MKKQNQSLIVGAKVVLDFPARWRGAKPEFQDQLKKDVASTEHWFGKEATVVDYTPSNENPYGVLLEDGQIGRYWDGAFSVKELPKDRDQEILDCIGEIRTATASIGKDMLALLTKMLERLNKLKEEEPL